MYEPAQKVLMCCILERISHEVRKQDALLEGDEGLLCSSGGKLVSRFQLGDDEDSENFEDAQHARSLSKVG